MNTELDQHRNIQAEHLLDELGLTWNLKWISVDTIDKTRSLANQARFEALKPELVLRYLTAAQAGAVFPAGIYGQNGEHKLITADGNHRNEVAYKLRHGKIPGYVFRFSDTDQFQAVADISNARLNGSENTLQERFEHAVRACERSSVTEKQAALIFGIPRGALGQYRRARAIRVKLTALKVKTSLWNTLSDSQISDLGGIVTDDAWPWVLSAIRDGVGTKQMCDRLRETKTIPVIAQRTAAQVALANEVTGEQTSARTLITKAKKDPGKMRLMQLHAALGVIQKTIPNPTDTEQELLDRIFALFT